MKRFKTILLSMLLLSVSSLSSFAASTGKSPREPAEYFFNETWHNYEEELANAKEQGKVGIMLFFEMDECPYCHYMKMNVLNNPRVQEYYRKHFLIFAVDIEGDIEMVNMKGKTMKQKDFAFREHRVRATPVIAFFDLDGKRIHRHIGKTNGIDEFMWMGEYIVDGSYKKMPFIRYKKMKRNQ